MKRVSVLLVLLILVVSSFAPVFADSAIDDAFAGVEVYIDYDAFNEVLPLTRANSIPKSEYAITSSSAYHGVGTMSYAVSYSNYLFKPDQKGRFTISGSLDYQTEPNMYSSVKIMLMDKDSSKTVTLYEGEGELYNSFSGKVVTGLNPNHRYYLKYEKSNDGFTADTELWIRLP